MNYYNEIQTLLNKLPKRYCVRFALYCAEDVIDKVDTKDKANAEQCIALVKEWLELELEPSKELEQKLKNAASTAYATYAASAASAASATSTASAAFTAYTAYTAYVASAAYAIYAIYDASAAYAAYAAYAASTASADSTEKLKKYYEYLLRMIHDIPRVEKEIYCLEDLSRSDS